MKGERARPLGEGVLPHHRNHGHGRQQASKPHFRSDLREKGELQSVGHPRPHNSEENVYLFDSVPHGWVRRRGRMDETTVATNKENRGSSYFGCRCLGRGNRGTGGCLSLRPSHRVPLGGRCFPGPHTLWGQLYSLWVQVSVLGSLGPRRQVIPGSRGSPGHSRTRPGTTRLRRREGRLWVLPSRIRPGPCKESDEGPKSPRDVGVWGRCPGLASVSGFVSTVSRDVTGVEGRVPGPC